MRVAWFLVPGLGVSGFLAAWSVRVRLFLVFVAGGGWCAGVWYGVVV